MSLKELQARISPHFTNDSLLGIVKAKTGASDIKVTSIEIDEDGSKRGSSYLSRTCWFQINASVVKPDGVNEIIRIPVFAKSIPLNIARTKTFHLADFFENEIYFYEKIWTAFETFQGEKTLPFKFSSIPVPLGTWCNGTDDFVLLSDLRGEGYNSADRGAGLDLDHITAILRLLARFHALSLALKDQHPGTFDDIASNLKETYFAEHFRPWYMKFQDNLKLVVLDAVQKELSVSYVEKFQQFLSQDLYGEICKWCQTRGKFSIVTHGDVWAPNFLIKYHEGQIGDIMMIDFQLARYTTLVNDITFFLFICADVGLLGEHWDQLIIEYHRELSSSLQSLGTDPELITLSELNAEIVQSMVCAVGVIIEGLTMSLLDEEDVKDPDSIQGTDAVPLEDIWIVHQFKEKAKRARIASLIKFVIDRNFI